MTNLTDALTDALAAALGIRRPPPLVGRLAPPEERVAAPQPLLRVQSPPSPPPPRVPRFSEALLEFVRTVPLERIAIEPTALEESDVLEAAPEAPSMLPKICRALISLNAYARDARRGRHVDFAYWCRNSGHPQAWYANQVVISEGEKVSSDWRMLSDRFRPVSPVLREAGRITMQSHIKISTGRASMSPRLYFYDDAAGATGQVHIGFVGGHAHIRTWRYAA